MSVAKQPINTRINTRFILIQTSHAGNVGAAARAIKTMGFHDMVLVRPRWANVLRREETIQRASGANDVLNQCRIVDTLDEALDGISHLCATVMTARDFGPPTRSPREHLTAYFETALHAEPPADTAPSGIAFLFGSERYGMANEDVYRCHVALKIPTHPTFGSLNLASAVQLVAYEWQLICAAPESLAASTLGPGFAKQSTLADGQQISGLLRHWEEMLTHTGYLDPEQPMKLLPRLQQIFNRAQLRDEEVNLLRGIARSVLQSTPQKKRE